MIGSGFSSPSTTLVCSDEYSSLKLIGDTPASNALNSDVSIGAGGTRILKPFKSSGVLISRVEEVIWRNPLSQILETGKIGVFAISDRTYSPNPPSIAFHTAS